MTDPIIKEDLILLDKISKLVVNHYNEILKNAKPSQLRTDINLEKRIHRETIAMIREVERFETAQMNQLSQQ